MKITLGKTDLSFSADTIQDGCLIFKQLGKKKKNQYCVLIIKTSHQYLLKIWNKNLEEEKQQTNQNKSKEKY